MGGHPGDDDRIAHCSPTPAETTGWSSAFLRVVERRFARGDMGFHLHPAGTLSQSLGEKIQSRRVALFGANQLDSHHSLDREGNAVTLPIEGGLVKGGLIDSKFRSCPATEGTEHKDIKAAT